MQRCQRHTFNCAADSAAKALILQHFISDFASFAAIYCGKMIPHPKGVCSFAKRMHETQKDSANLQTTSQQ
jgi:hypothetical protein